MAAVYKHCNAGFSTLWKYAQLSGVWSQPHINIVRWHVQTPTQIPSMQNNTQADTHTCVQWRELSLRYRFTPSCSQALTIGLTGIKLDTLPSQLDYTSDSVVIRLYYFAQTHLWKKYKHVPTHQIPVIVSPSLPSIPPFARVWCVFDVESLRSTSDRPSSRLRWTITRGKKNKYTAICLLCPSVWFNLCCVYGRWSMNLGALDVRPGRWWEISENTRRDPAADSDSSL